MHRCLNCEVEFEGTLWTCPACRLSPRQENGYISFVTATPDDAFVPSSFAWLAKAEEGFWWFEARNELIEWAMARWSPRAKSFLEIGCGTGFVVSRIAGRFPAADLSAAELFQEGLPFVRERLPTASLYQIDARRLPFSREFDVIGAFDVIEHIDEDEEVISQVHRAIKPAGIFLITVPQHPFLWSKFDEFGHHKRRYTRRELVTKLKGAGFEVLAVRSFVSLLFPLQLMARLTPTSNEYDVEAEFRIAPLMNMLLRAVMRVEFTLIRAGLSFPFGGSLLAVARIAK